MILTYLLGHTMYSIPIFEVPVERQVTVKYIEGDYFGQPDMVLLDDDKTLLTVYPRGHGHGAAYLSKSLD